MLGLQLRDEFQGEHTRGTAIVLRQEDGSGAAQQAPGGLLEITYPTHDILTALYAIADGRPSKPLVLKGDRGRGKSHIMAVVHHAIAAPEAVQAWARQWGQKLGVKRLSDITLPTGFFPITEAVHNHEYPHLWDLLFARHPQGQLFKGKFQASGAPCPAKSLLIEMFTAQPVALILDEFQKWFDGLSDEPGATGKKWFTLASNFVQCLSELAVERPDLLIFVISVLNNQTEAFQQVHRNTPVVIDFQGSSAKADRQRLVLHRLFKNRNQIVGTSITSTVNAYASERFRLLCPHLTEADRDRVAREVAESWPFAPELLQLLEDHILMSEAAQESRDLIRILASVYRARGESVTLITPADFTVDDDASGVQTLLSSIAVAGEQEQLREIATRNLEVLKGSGANVPHAREIVSAIWIRTMSPGKIRGATRQELQLDITRDVAIDDNTFKSELSQLIDNSMNIHGAENLDGRLRFETGENPKTKVKATARNDKLWKPASGSSSQVSFPGKDIERLRKTLQHILVPENKSLPSRVLVLGEDWSTSPWSGMEPQDKPDGWSQPVLVVIPVAIPGGSQGAAPVLGPWLAENVTRRRSYVRFLLVAQDAAKGLYDDEELLFNARCAYLCGEAWKDDPKYKALLKDFDNEVRKTLTKRFTRFALLRRWNYGKPETCSFEVETIANDKGGPETASTVEEIIKRDLFDPNEFEKIVLSFADKSKKVEDLLKHLSEPPAQPTVDAVPFLGAEKIYEELIRIAVAWKLALNVGGNWFKRLPEHKDDDEARAYLKRAYRSGAEMNSVLLAHPPMVGGGSTSGTQAPSTTPTPSPSPSSTPAVGSAGSPDLFADPTSPRGATAQAPASSEGGSTTPVSTVAEPVFTSRKTEAPASGVQLSGSFDQWGVPSDGQLQAAKIEFANISVPMLKKVLAGLHSSLKASLEVKFEEPPQP
jgi:hypothetical protein